MKCQINVNMRLKKPLSIVFAALLLMSMAVVATATPWDGVPDDPTPAQSIWVDPKNTTGLSVGNVFTVDVLINVTDPPGAGTGLYGFQYKLKWNSTVLNVTEIQTHFDNVPSGDIPPEWTMVFVAANETGSLDGEDYHSYAVAVLTGTAFTGVASLCTYKFRVLLQPAESAPDFCGLLDLYDTIPVDDTAEPIAHTTVDGMYCVPARVLEKPIASFTWSPPTPEAGETVTFDASASNDSDGTIVSYAWNFSDGTPIATETDPTTTHSYTAIGTYEVTLTVTDNDGLTNSTTKSITIAKRTSSVSISASPDTIKVNETTTISGSITPNPGADVTVTIHYRLTGETWATLTTATTDSDGKYSYVWTPDEAGDYEVYASWPGDATTLEDESDPVTVTVEKEEAPLPYLLIAAIVIVIVIVAAIAIYFLKIRKS